MALDWIRKVSLCCRFHGGPLARGSGGERPR